MVLGTQEPIVAKAKQAQINTFINDTIELIRKNDANKEFVAENKEKSKLHLNSLSVYEAEDTTFQTCRLVIKSDIIPDKLNSIGSVSGFKNYHVIQFATPEDTEKAYKFYSDSENIISVTPDIVYKVTSDVDVLEESSNKNSNVPVNLDSWGSKATGLYDVKKHIETNLLNRNEFIIGVVDSGVFTENEFIKNRIIRTYFNVAADGEENDENDVYYGTGHGTNVSSIIVDNTPENVKIKNYRFIDRNNNATPVIAALAILKAVEDEVDIINASFQTPDESGIFQAALNEAHNKDILIICAAGNSNSYVELSENNLPASDEKVITVSALGRFGIPTNFTSYSHIVDVVAPGESMPVADGVNSYYIADGTSFSAPMVSSLVAMMKVLYPTYSNTEIEVKIESTAIPTDLIAESDLFGYGIIDSVAACGLERTETPEINFDSGKYTGEISIELSTYDDCDIYYTTDGSYPTIENGILYTEPITLSNDILFFKAVAFDEQLPQSQCVKRFYRLQTVGYDDLFTIDDHGKITSYIETGVCDLIIPDSVNGVSVTDIEANVFSNAQLIGVTMPENLDFVPNGIFSGNKNIMYADGENVKTIEASAFRECENLYSLNFPNVESIELSAFFNNSSLSEAFFPYCTSIGQKSFSGCYSLRKAFFPKLKNAGFDCFKNCLMLSSVYAPKLKDFSLYATMFSGHFSSCELYKGLDLPSIEIIEKAFFYNPITTPSAQMHNYTTKLELSNVKEIRSLPQGFCRADYGSVVLVLPSTLKQCEPDYFDEVESDWYIVYGSKGTYAEQWAKENGFEFIPISEENKETAIITNLPEHYYSYMRPLEADVIGFNKTYQWCGSDSADNTTGTPITGATEKKFDPNEYKQYKYYYCVVTSQDVGYEPIKIRTGVTENKSYVKPEINTDYSELKKVVNSIPKDLSIYTDESVEKLQSLLKLIDWEDDTVEQDIIDKLKNDIEDAIKDLKLRSADYSDLEEAIKTIPVNLSIYTDESVANLNSVLNLINTDYNITEQHKVDNYVVAVLNAVAALELKSADYTELEKVIKAIPDDLSIYTDESTTELKTLLAEIDKNLDITNQEQVDKWVEEIPIAVQKLVLKPADYTTLDAAISEIPDNLSVYTDESVMELEKVVNRIDRNLDITQQEQVDNYVTAVEQAISKLNYKPADYTLVSDAIATIPSDLSIYTSESVAALESVVDSIDYSLDITEQEKVDEYAEQIRQAVSSLKKECWIIRLIKSIIVFFNWIAMCILSLFN